MNTVNINLTIIVNASLKTLHQEDLTFSEIVSLAFPNYNPTDNMAYTVTYSGAKATPSAGTLSFGDTIHITNNTNFNVTQSGQS